MWVSPQGFTKAWMDEFYGILKPEPTWLTGVVFGPQVRDSLPILRAKTPKRYRIRHYPDITHSLRCQYPVPDWDVAHALTSQREQINPRPLDQAIIFRSLMPYVDRLHHLLRRLQRRRQQVRVERAGLGSASAM